MVGKMAGKKPCTFFQLGKCTKGDACTYAHVADPNFKRKACQHFANGTCRRGKTCTYSHAKKDINFLRATSGASSNNNGNAGGGVDTTEAQFKEWRYNIPTEPGKPRPLGPAMTRFCKQALTLIDGEAGLMQEVILLLASDGGLQRIIELVDQQFEKLSEAQFARIFDAQLLPFLKVITHKNVIASVILGPRLMTIYNIIYNGDGERAVSLFTAVTKHLQTLNLSDSGDNEAVDESAVGAVESSLAALYKLVEINTGAQIHDGLKLVVETLALLFEEPVSEAIRFAIKPSQKHLRRVEQRMGLGQALPHQAESVRATGARATFELARERPGELSEDGPRHDNDKVDIRQISILPTLQEIQSSRIEYLPLADPRDWHLGGLEGLLDRHFRLLREDTVGQLRDAAKFELERLQNPQAQTNGNQRKRQGARTYVYENVAISDITLDSYIGMEFALSFDQPKDLQRKSENQRRDWWQGSKRLGDDALICLLSSGGSATFLMVVPEPKGPKKDMATGAVQVPLHKNYDFWSDPARAHIIAKPVKQSDIHPLLAQLLNHTGEQFSLVEFPGVLLPAFQPTLQAMQRMSDSLDVPFSDILAPVATPGNPNREVEVQLPAYATRPGFQFNLSKALTTGADLHLTPGTDLNNMASELEANSTFDQGQAEAVVSSLSRSLALIQGPPGTGKSYTGVQLIKILLDNKAAGDLGPIVCVCFTNHALDQGLERLLDEGVNNVVRLGGRSKSDRLADVNLRSVVQRLDLTKTEKSDRWDLMKKVDKEAKEINDILDRMGRLGSPAAVQAHLEERHPEQHEQIFSGVDEEGFTNVDYHPEAVMERWLKSAPWGIGRPRLVEDLVEEHALAMTGQERRILHNHWVTEMGEYLHHRLNVALKSYNELKANLDSIRTELDLRVLRQANIIGITTSGLARSLDLLRRVNAKVLLCEEAGEVLESHCLTALLPSVEHAILIGDHQQLRPHVQNYDLSTESKNGAQYSLDVSLFERLVQPQNILAQPLPFCTLEVQRRMHPSISQLVRKTLYPRLQDAPSVAKYPSVVGMRQRLFWMHHENKENDGGDGMATSHTNDYEVDMTAAVVKHLVRQGVYASSDIAVITPYLGQLRKIRKKLGSTFEIVLNERDVDDLQKEGDDDSLDGLPSSEPPRRSSVARGTLLQALRIATVDNFQGEEAKVVVVSLVRSNPKNNPGFLKTSNRINVLLSRAQHGMYILGNANTTGHVGMWSKVLQIFRDDGNYGTELQLCCPRHEDTPIVVRNPDDFVRLSPEAGCDLACDKQLPCGHACVSKCHSEMLHNAVHCMKPCTRPKPGCTHNCPLPCGDPCDRLCQEIVDNVDVKLACGHRTTSLPCYQYQDPSKVVCEVPVNSTVPDCEHKTTEPCHVDVYGDGYLCMAKCGATLPCGHTCQKPCFKCRLREDGVVIRTEHGQCRQPCQRNFTTCKHFCKATCHGEEPCPLCEAACDVQCAHSKCTKKCHEPCAPCAEDKCSSRCPHAQCMMPCAAPCDWLPCSRRCEKQLACGCQCPSVCGEACPSATFCQNCANDDIKEMQADMVMFETYHNIDLDEDPCIFTTCGHIFTLASMDGIMDMPMHYDVDPWTGAFIGLKTSSEPFSSDELKSCPTCRGSLRNIARYGRIVRRALLDESAKKLTAWSNRTCQGLSLRLLEEQERLLSTIDSAFKPNQDVKLDGRAADQLQVIKHLKTGKRYRQTFAIRTAIYNFAAKLRGDEQPYQRVRDLVETVRRQNADSGIAEFEFSSEELQLREHLQAASLLIRVDIILLADVIEMHSKTATGMKKGALQVDFATNRVRCEELIKEAQATSNVRQEVEGHVFWARFAAMECGTLDLINEEAEPGTTHRLDTLKDGAFDRLTRAEKICGKFADSKVDPTSGLLEETVEVKRMLDEGVSSSEMRMVVKAMAAEFSGTGHWYKCANGHPFTVGECGMPMELARCPACGAGIGGQSHRPTAGVTHAHDIERQFGTMNLR